MSNFTKCSHHQLLWWFSYQ